MCGGTKYEPSEEYRRQEVARARFLTPEKHMPVERHRQVSMSQEVKSLIDLPQGGPTPEIYPGSIWYGEKVHGQLPGELIERFHSESFSAGSPGIPPCKYSQNRVAERSSSKYRGQSTRVADARMRVWIRWVHPGISWKTERGSGNNPDPSSVPGKREICEKWASTQELIQSWLSFSVRSVLGPGVFSFREPLNRTTAERSWAPDRMRQVKRPRSRRIGVSL